VPNLAVAKYKCYLIGSWYCFAGVIFLSLVAHFISMWANRWSIENDNAEDNKYKLIFRCWNYTIRSFNFLMIVGLFVGILLLIAFVNQNI
jgi:hypothetical protein